MSKWSFRKKFIVALSSIIAVVTIFTAGVYAATDIKLFVNGKAITTDIQIVDGSSYVPLRAVSEALGADVKWDGPNRTILINSATAAAPAPAPQSSAKSFDVNVTLQSGPMTMKITKVTLDPALKPQYRDPYAAIILDVSVENTSTDTVNWYPNFGTLVTNTKEQIDGHTSFDSDQVGGEFVGKVVKTGKIVFPVKTDVTAITSLTFKVTGPWKTIGDSAGEDKTTEIILK